MSISIISVLTLLNIKYKRVGDRFAALCPLHNDTDESFVIYPATNSWCCFGNCRFGVRNGGDVEEFVKQYLGVSFFEAKLWLEKNFDSFNIKSEPLPDLTIKQPKIVPHDFVVYWHAQLTDRTWFYQRGFDDNIINREMWGWDGRRYCIPVWEGKPQYSKCLGARRRRPDGEGGPKYIGLTNMNQPTVWGRWYCQDKNYILAFAGELDAARAVQDGFAAFSLVNGINSFSRFPAGWPDLWFPNSKKMVVIFDKKEEVYAGHLASIWNKHKGMMEAKVFHWPLDTKDYCEFRERFPISKFKNILQKRIT